MAFTTVEGFFGYFTKQRLEFVGRHTVTDDSGDQDPHAVVGIFDQATVDGGIGADSIAAQPRNHSRRSGDGGSSTRWCPSERMYQTPQQGAPVHQCHARRAPQDNIAGSHGTQADPEDIAGHP